MSGLDDTGLIVQFCPICEAWQIDADVQAIGWPLAGALVEQAIGEHVAEHSGGSGVEWNAVAAVIGATVETLTCGCVLTVDAAADLARLVACGPLHKQIAQTTRKPGSRIIVN